MFKRIRSAFNRVELAMSDFLFWVRIRGSALFLLLIFPVAELLALIWDNTDTIWNDLKSLLVLSFRSKAHILSKVV